MWDDLFRAAAGEDDVVETQHVQTIETEANPRKRQPSTSSESRNRKRKKKKSRNHHGEMPSRELLERILESRTDPIDLQVWSKLPSWLSPGSSLCNPKVCSGWEQDDACGLNSKCRNCGRTLLYHSLALSPSVARKRNTSRMALAAFVLVRDIRCCCSCFLDEFYGLSGDRATISTLQDYIISATAKSTQLASMDFSSILSPGEANILKEKFRKIKRVATALRERVQHLSKDGKKNKRRFKPGDIFDSFIRLMVCCDATYFRMYYLQNSGNLPVENQDVFLPHPTSYFGSKNVAWNVIDHTADLLQALRKSNSQISDERWDGLVNDLGIESSSRELDPLTFMQKNRLAETILIFRKTSWVDSKEATSQFIESIKHQSKERDLESLFYTAHETPAPVILREWRDSCRDFLCNLYAYATISPDMIDEIKVTLRQTDIVCRSTVEIGAGTGYISNLLCKSGLSVSAFDVAPTTNGNSNSSNEYHGSSPPFCRVEYADSQDLRTALDQRNAKETALLLCYPPPLSDVAEVSLKSFVIHGGRIVIHIGEFSGLTGSSKFEQILSCSFDLKYRRRCLNWGSDTAEVTIWTKSKQAGNKGQKHLVQCSQSKICVATRRLKICRSLSYKTRACFGANKVERGLHFAFNMIPDALNENDLISFDDKKYFESLPCKYNL